MKRFFSTILCVFSLVVVLPKSNAFAVEPTTTAVPTHAPEIIGKSAVGGVYNDPVTAGGPAVSITNEKPALIQLPVNATMNIDSYNVPKMDFPSRLFYGVNKYFMTKAQQDNSIPSENNLYISGAVKLCKAKGADGKTTEVYSFYKTEPAEDYHLTDEGLRSVKFLGNETLSQNAEGKFNFKREPLELNDTASLPVCDTINTGSTQESEPVKVVKKFSVAGFVEQLLSILSGKTAQGSASVNSIQFLPYANEMEQTTNNIASSYLPSTMDAANGKSNGESQNELVSGQTVVTRTENTAAMDAQTKSVMCSLVPKTNRASLGLTDADCTREVKTTTNATTCSTGSLPAFSVKPECKLKSTSINSYTLSTKLVETIEAAASAYNVPASLMLGIIFGEGSFNGNKIFTSSSVDTYLDGCTLLPNCSGGLGNIVPFSDWSELADAVTIVDNTRTPNACNLTDGIFALAKFISKYYYAPAFAGQSCFGINLNATATTYTTHSTQSCSTWTQSDAESAIRYWEFGNQWDKTCKNCATGAGSCGSGGFTTTPTPTGSTCLGGSWGMRCMSVSGGDTCDTISSRVSPKSHNGCIWDVYKSH